MTPPRWSRRDVLLASGALVALAACGDDSDAGSDTTAGGDADGNGEQYELVAGFPRDNSFVAQGIPQRLPFLIALAADAPLDDLGSDPLTFSFTTEDGATLGETEVTPHAEGLPRAYLPAEFTFEPTGVVLASTTFRGQDLLTPILVSPAADVRIPQVGAPLPSVTTPTTADPAGVDPICTRDPNCPFHDLDLVTALGNGKPTVLLVGTPLYCRTAICGPVLELMIEQLSGRDDLNVIHAEVWANPEQVESIDQATAAPVVTAFGLPFEPILFGADATGTIVDRLDLIWDVVELDALVETVSA